MLKLKRLFGIILAATTLIGGNTFMVNAETTNTQKKPTVQYAHSLDSQAYSGNDLGAVYTKNSTTFKVWAPTASRVAVKLYTTGSPEEEGAMSLSTTTMTKGSNGVWSVTLAGDKKNLYYTYLVTVDGITRETADIYAKAAGVNGNRSMIVDLDSTDPEGWDKDEHILYDNPTDAVVWEIHMRDFSVSETSGVSVKYKGKYLAFTENGTTLNGEGEISTCIDYLKKLGVTHVQLLPVYDYATVDETKTGSDEFNWGYDPKNYNVPEGSYSTDPFNGNTRITEFKQMIMALHNAGIGVIMDVVYNHTYTAEGSWFENTVPGYYYRMNSDGTFSDASGCGNETASDHLMYRKYMIDSVLYWTNEYHIDGFRFDLMGIHDVTTMNEIRKALDTKVKDGTKIIMYGEPWSCNPVGTTMPTAVRDNVNKLDSRIGAFNDVYRDAVKGHVFNSAEKGFVQDGSSKELLKSGILANCVSGTKWANQPSQAVTYASAHDNYTLYDKLVLSVKNDGSYEQRDDSIVDMNKLVAAATLTSQGISFMQAGEEFARTKYGDSNSFISPDKINKLDWSSLVKYADLNSYYSGLIDIRKNFKPFRDSTTTSAKLVQFADTDDGVIAYTLENKLTAGKEWSNVAVLLNASDSETTVTLKAADGKSLPAEWVIVADKYSAGLDSLGTVSGNTVKVPAKSAIILADKTSFEKLNLKSDKCTVTVEYKDAKSGDVIDKRVLTGTEGSTYITSKDESLDIQYDFNRIEGNEKGKFTKENQTVTYYYDKFEGAICTLTVNYMQSGDALLGTSDMSVADSVVQKVREGTQYTAPIKEVDNMQVDMSVFPTNMVGTAKKDDITVNYYYKAKQKTDLVIHYYNSENMKKVYAVVYKNDGDSKTSYTDSKGTEMTADSNLGKGWYTLNIKDIGNLSDVYVSFTDNGKITDSGSDENGYCINNEVWIENGKVTYTGQVNVVYVQNNGKVLKTDTITGKEGSEYTTAEQQFDGLKFTASTSNTSGKYSKTPTYVIYSYDEQTAIEKPEMQTVIILCASAVLMLAAAGVLAVIYRRKKNKLY
ncbi:MAG: type I pullulanase [Acutalibacteraceae bacterium]